MVDNDIPAMETVLLGLESEFEWWDRDRGVEFFERIDAPPDLIHIDRVASVMLEIIRALTELGDEVAEPVLYQWQQVCTWLLANGSFLEGIGVLMHRNVASDENTCTTLYGKSMSHPLYTLLWTGLDDDDLWRQFLALKTAVFRIWPLFSEKTIKQGNKNTNALYQLSSVVRELGEYKNRKVLKGMPDSTVPIASYLRALKMLVKEHDNAGGIYSLLRWMEVALGMREFVTRDVIDGGGGGGGGGPLRGVFPRQSLLRVAFEVEDPITDGNLLIRAYEPVGVRPPLRGRESDLTADDLVPGYTFYELIPLSCEMGNVSAKALALTIKGRLNALAMRNQMLETHRSILPEYCVETIARDIGLATSVDAERSFDQCAVIAATLVLMYGFDDDWLSEFVISDSWTEAKKTSARISYVPGSGELRVFVPHMTSTPLSDEARSVVIPVQPILRLSVNNVIDALCSAMLKNNTCESLGSRVIRLDAFGGELRSRADRLIKDLLGRRYSIAALRNQAFRRIASYCDDVAEAMMISGGDNGMASTRRHYTTQSAMVLEERSRESFNAFVQELADEYRWDDWLLLQWTVNPHGKKLNYHVGARLTPTRKAVQNLVRLLRERLRDPVVRQDIVLLHNTYTAYTLLMMEYGVGNRAVNRQFSLESSICYKRLLLVLSDKEPSEFYNSRVVAVPQVCIEQLINYREHREQLLAHLSLQHTAATDLLINSRRKVPGSWSKTRLEEFSEQFPAHMFFLDANLRPDYQLIACLRKLLIGIWPLPLNTNRHYIRFNIRAQGVSGEMVDALLSHWQHGEEPYGNLSTLTPHKSNRVVVDEVDRLMIEDGWAPERGLGDGC